MSLIFEKIPKILASVEAIGKDRKNLQQGYNFRGIDDMYNDLHKYFAAEGVFITSKILNSFREERPTKSGGVMIYSIIDFEFTFHASDGSSVSTQQRGEASDSGDKSSNKSASTALKYALMQTLLIPTEEDKDTENASPEFTPKTQAQPQPQSTQTNQSDVRPELIQQLNSANNADSFNALINRKEYWKQSRSDAEGKLFQAKARELNLKWDAEAKKYA